MKRLFSSTLFLLLLSTLTACVGPDPRCVSLPGGGNYCLQPTSAVTPFAVQQKVVAVFNGRQETMIVELEVDEEGMRFAGLTPFGQKIAQAGYDNQQVNSGLWPDKRLPPVLLLVLLQLAIWPADSVRAGLGGSAVLEDGEEQRRVLDDGTVLAEVGYTNGQPPYGNMRIGFPAWQVKFEVTTLDANGTK